MKKIFSILLVVISTIVYAKPTVVVSILPQETFVKKIAKDKLDVTVMVTPGSSPHSYEPKPSQMISISKADVYFSIGIEFEDTWLDRFKSQNKELKFVNLSDKIEKIEKNHRKSLDPHTWTSPNNVKIMAQSIYETLVQVDPLNEKFYKSNLNDFINEIKDTDTKIKDILKDTKPKTKFMAFHPAWGYFAKDYNLVQIAVKIEGKKPKPKDMIMVINEAKEENIKVIFTQPEFSDKSTQVIAKEMNINVKKISPLDTNWSENLINMASAIANK